MLSNTIEPHQNSKNFLLIIDPQVDFYDGGNLGIPGSIADAKKTKEFICNNLDSIHEIYVSLDTHNKMHIAHGAFWDNQPDGCGGKEPNPFTLLNCDANNANDPALYTIDEKCPGGIDKSQPWYPKDSTYKNWTRTYCEGLAAAGFPLCIWPEHCIIGGPGHNVQPDIHEALQKWAKHNPTKLIKYLPKGMNNYTEMYSIIRAEVPIESDKLTKTNVDLCNALGKAEKVVVCGQAKSHCVNYSVRDLVRIWYQQTDAIRPGSRQSETRSHESNATANVRRENIILLSDAMSSVPGFESAGDKFFVDMAEVGCTIEKCDEVVL